MDRVFYNRYLSYMAFCSGLWQYDRKGLHLLIFQIVVAKAVFIRSSAYRTPNPSAAKWS
jgi:hypothetical protein